MTSLLATAIAAHHAGRLDQAEAGYRSLLAAEPGHPDAYKYHYNLAATLQGQGREGEALEHYRKASLAAPPAVTTVGLALAQLLCGLGRPAEAELEFRRIIAVQPRDAAVHFSLASALQTQGKLEEAEDSYRAALEYRPGHAPTLVNLGTVLQGQGRLNDAAAVHRQALKAEPDFAPAHVNLGAVLQAQGKMMEAVKHYRKALTLNPTSAQVLFNLGTAVQTVGWLDEAVRCYQDALRLAPAYAEAANNLGLALEAKGHLHEAAASFAEACRLQPLRSQFHNALGCCLYALGRRDSEGCRDRARQWLAAHPEQPIARHMACALLAEDPPPDQPPAGYVRALFEGFASSFEHELLSIGYCGPQLTAAAFARLIRVPKGDLAVLDAGCGTGLCGPVLRPYARTLTGIDISASMLDHARSRGLYDILQEAELTVWLKDHSCAFDLIAAADVLCYFGDLGPVLGWLAGALKPGGALTFTVEQASRPDLSHVLAPHGRYFHGERVLRALLAAHGLGIAHLFTTNLRYENSQPSPHLVVLAVRS